MALLGITRRWHLCDKVPLREIAKRLGISRNTVRRYLHSETTEPAYAKCQTAGCPDPYAHQLAGWLKTEAAKSRKQRRSLKQLHEDLVDLGFKRSYDRIAAFARQWRGVKLSGAILHTNEQHPFLTIWGMSPRVPHRCWMSINGKNALKNKNPHSH